MAAGAIALVQRDLRGSGQRRYRVARRKLGDRRDRRQRLTQRALGEKIDLVVLGPETAIAAGVGDRLREAGLAVFGPNRSAGRLESSKIFAKRFMERHAIPTAKAVIVHSLDGARSALDDWQAGVSSSKPTASPPAKASS